MYPYIIYLTNNRYCNIVCDCEKKIPKKEIKKNSPFIIKVLRILHLVADSAHIMTTFLFKFTWESRGRARPRIIPHLNLL